MCCGRCVCCDQTPACKCAFVLGVLILERRNIGRGPLAVGRRGATFAVVAVSSQFVVKCACRVFGRAKGGPKAVIILHVWVSRIVFVVLLLDIVVSRADSTRIR